MSDTPDRQLPWYLDAIVYCVDLARFRDSDGDGYGDFKGLIEKLDYLVWLGVDVIWLLPFYRSPREDDGYDVLDHFEIDHRLGTTGDFVKFLREAEHRNIKVMIDLVINHTSIEHRWFKESRDPAAPKRDWYVWVEDLKDLPDYPPIFPPIQKTTWTWQDRGQGHYLHHFYDFEPDLNTQNKEFQAEIRNMIEYWIRLGVRGFRVDGAPFFGQKRHPNEEAVHALLHDIHVWARDIHEQTVLLPEANIDIAPLEPYINNADAQMLFNFFGSQYLFLALATEEAAYLQKVIEMVPPGRDDFQWLNFLRNHDELSLDRLSKEQQQTVLDAFSPDPDSWIYKRGSRRRLAPLLDGDRQRMELAFSLLFAIPGTPMFINGDEIGMGDNLDLPERAAARLPMQWSSEMPNGGFSEAYFSQLITPVLDEGPYGIKHVNVEDERNDDGSFLNWVRTLIQTRKKANRWMVTSQPEMAVPKPSVLVLTYSRDDEPGVLTIVHNLSSEGSSIEMGSQSDVTPKLMSDGSSFSDGSVKLGPFGYAWWVSTEAKGTSTKQTQEHTHT